MNIPVLSIIVPVYNCEKYISEAINSILKQPCKDVEILIVDDGSQDTSGVIADRFAAEHHNIRVFHISNSGVSVARNRGIQEARGEYIGFLDADDVLCKDVYSNNIRDTLASGEYEILSFAFLKGVNDLKNGRLYPAKAGLFPRESKEFVWQTHKPFWSYLYKRSLFSETICFPVGVRYHEDVCFLFLISRSATNIMQYTKPWLIYRMNPSSVMHSLTNADYILEEIEAWDWCKRRSTTKKDRDDCNGNIFSYMVEYIKFSCYYGARAEVIQQKVNACKPFLVAMENYGNFWINKESAEFFAEFMQSPHRLWRKYRLIGLFYLAGKKFIRTTLGEMIDRKLRYRLRLTEYLC